jgi:PAS domain S-box-containing protein
MSANSWEKFRRFLGKGQHQRTLGIALDRREAADRALDLSEQQFRILVESVTDYAIYMLDANGHVTSWNTGAQRIKGYSADEILGQHFSRFYTENDRRNGLPQRALETAVRDGRWEGEGWRVRKDGSQLWVNAVIHPIRDEGLRVNRRSCSMPISRSKASFIGRRSCKDNAERFTNVPESRDGGNRLHQSRNHPRGDQTPRRCTAIPPPRSAGW